MAATILYMSMSLDGFITGPNDGPGNAMGDGGMILHDWLWAKAAPEDSPNQAIGKLTGINRQVSEQFMSTGAVVAGRGTFEAAHGWEGDHHDGVPIFIFSRHHKPDWAAKWELVRYDSDIAQIMRHAKAAAGTRNVMVHGAGLVTEALKIGALDEIMIHLSPVLLGEGRRLFDHLGVEQRKLERIGVFVGETGVTHLHYRVLK